jgi:hypothetical protein
MTEHSYLPEELVEMDRLLAETFSPVQPRENFVSILRNQLLIAFDKKRKTKKVTKGILVAGGILGGGLMIFTIIRTLTGEDGALQKIGSTISRLLKKREQPVSA